MREDEVIASVAQEALAEICSLLQYLVDRGQTCKICSVLTRVRYVIPTPIIDNFEVIAGDKVVRITPEEIADHICNYDDEGMCDCGEYNEDNDLD